MNQKRKQQLITILALLFISASCMAAELTPINKGLGTLVATLTGTTGITIATIAICGFGLACMYGYCQWINLLYSVAGIAILFGGKTIVTLIKAALGA